jgi:hypothetical protein
MMVSKLSALVGMGLLLLLVSGCPSGVAEAIDAGVDAPQQDRPPQEDAPPFYQDAGPGDDAAAGDGGATGDGGEPTDSGPGPDGGGPCYPEPDESTGGDTCAEALDRGALQLTTSTHVTVSGNLWPAADVDWYKVQFVDSPAPADCGKFKARIAFTQNPSDHFRFDVLLDNCTVQATCLSYSAADGGVAPDGGVAATGLTSFSLDGVGACPCVAAGTPTTDNVFICQDYSVTVRIRVFRKEGAPVLCENYELSLDNG